MSNPLGYCQAPIAGGAGICTGDLCVSGHSVRCIRCGHEVVDHPHTKALADAKPQILREVTPIDYAATVPDRVNILEKTVRELTARVGALEAKLASVATAAVTESHPLRKGK